MSLVDLLNDDNEWVAFLNRKKALSHLPDKVIKKYDEYISNGEYKFISNAIVEGSYKFSIPKKSIISKRGNNKKRVIYMYKKDETYVLKMLTFLMYKYDYLFMPNLYSFRQNIGVKNAIRNIMLNDVIGNMYAYKVDISNYFNSIPADKLLIELKADLNDDRLYKLIESLIGNDEVAFQNEIINEKKGIMAGTPISAFLANYYLKDLDKYFYDIGSIYLRYADDIIVFGKNEEDVIKYSEIIKMFLKNKGLSINEEKEFFYKPNDKIEFLGFSFQGKIIDISDNSFRKIKAKIRRSARSIRRWMLKKDVSKESALKLINKKFNKKFFGKNEEDITWKYWYFPIINTTNTLKKIDNYMQDEQRYMITGVHNKRNFEKVPYSLLKICNYKSLVNEYYKFEK